MSSPTIKQLHWTQRVAFLRHNLHSAARSNNFGFFKALQASGLVEGTNYAATLTSALIDDADGTLASLDNLNTSLALAYQSAFEKVSEKVEKSMHNIERNAATLKLREDISSQMEVADVAIDRLANAAIALINGLDPQVQDHAAKFWITGVTIVADCMEVSIQQMQCLAFGVDDQTLLEQSKSIVKASVHSAVTGLKGIFSLMEPPAIANEGQSRSIGITGVGSAILRRFSNAFQPQDWSRNASVASPNTASESNILSEPLQLTHSPAHILNRPDGLSPMDPLYGYDFHQLNALPGTPRDNDETDPFDKTGNHSFLQLTVDRIRGQDCAVGNGVY